jgi:hypothetical protein
MSLAARRDAVPGGPLAPLVTVDLWHVPARRVGAALGRMALGRAQLRRVPGITFGRLVGTGAPGAFTPLDAEPRRWGLVAVWDEPAAARAFGRSALASSWARIADEHFHTELRPLAWRGRWSGREPFGPAPAAGTEAPPGPVAVLTRARLAPRRATTFWRAAPAVAADLAALAGSAAGPLLAIGIGEAPLAGPRRRPGVRLPAARARRRGQQDRRGRLVRRGVVRPFRGARRPRNRRRSRPATPARRATPERPGLTRAGRQEWARA